MDKIKQEYKKGQQRSISSQKYSSFPPSCQIAAAKKKK